MYITDKKALAVAQEVVATHAPRILAQLGLHEHNDGILDRITALAEPLSDSKPHSAIFLHTIIRTGFIIQDARYELGSGMVEINSTSIFQFRTKKGTYMDFKPARVLVSTRRLRHHLTFLLAHELRHYWQFYTGEVWKHRMGGVSLMPYEWRWEETDANEFAHAYVRGLRR